MEKFTKIVFFFFGDDVEYLHFDETIDIDCVQKLDRIYRCWMMFILCLTVVVVMTITDFSEVHLLFQQTDEFVFTHFLHSSNH